MKKVPARNASRDRARRSLIDLPATLRIFTVREAAGILKVTTSVVRKLIHEGKLRGSRVGVQIRIPAPAIEEFLEKAVCSGPDPRRDPRRKTRAGSGPERAAAPPPWS